MTTTLRFTILSLVLIPFLLVTASSSESLYAIEDDCFDGIDDDGDGLVDCDDPECGPGYFTDSGQLIGNSASQSVAVGDVNDDGFPDAFIANNNSQPNRVWLSDGLGKFIDSGQSLGSLNSTDAKLEDLDGDGDLDVFVTNYSQPNTVWINQGGDQGGTPGQFLDSGQVLGSAKSRGVDLGDLDHDGDLDAVVANDVGQPNSVWINQGFNQNGTAGQFLSTDQKLGTSASFDLALGDINKDGHLDVVVANAAFQPNRLWLGDGTGKFQISTQSLGFSNSRSVVLEDLDNDHDLDVVVVNYQQPNIVYLNTGGLLDEDQQLGAGASWGVDVGDLNGDSLPDVFIANYDQSHRVWLNEGNGVLSDSGQDLGLAISSAVALADVDDDGDLDAFVTNMQGNQIWLNNLMEACGSDADGDGILNECDADQAGGPDCDDNGIKDSCDPDENGNGIPDVCEVPVFRRGDVNTDSSVDISDSVMLISYLFNIQDISCVDTADANDNGNVNIVDLVHLLMAVMDGAPEIPAPGPLNCGPDPTDDALECDSYNAC